MVKLRQFPLEHCGYNIVRSIASWKLTPAEISARYGFLFERIDDELGPSDHMILFIPKEGITFGLQFHYMSPIQCTQILINAYCDPPLPILDKILMALEITHNDLLVVDDLNELQPPFRDH